MTDELTTLVDQREEREVSVGVRDIIVIVMFT